MHRGIEETVTFSKEKQTLSPGEKITVCAMCSLCEMPWASRIAGCFVLSLHSLTSTPAARSSRGNMSCIRTAWLLQRGVRVSRVSIHPTREKRRFVFLRAGLNLIIGKQAHFSPPFYLYLHLTDRVCSRVAFFFAPSHRPTDIDPYSETSRLNSEYTD